MAKRTERWAGRKREQAQRRTADEGHGSDWERGAPEWAPPRDRPEGSAPGEGEHPGPAKAGDPPLERPLGERSRNGGGRPDPAE